MAAKERGVRNRELHDALFTFARAATELLSAEHEAGAEIRFDVDAAPGRARRCIATGP